MDAVRELPPISLPDHDFDHLVAFGLAAFQRGDPNAAFLLTELERAAYFRNSEASSDVVTLNSQVGYRLDDEVSVQARKVLPPTVSVEAEDEVSAASLLGIALLGLKKGDRMPFRDDATGQEHVLEVEDLAPPAPALEPVPFRPFGRLLR
ncbi:transcription elongation GreA/GreB family factor [Methylorubrum rhodesianum]|jgi:regulator of nucleoside diphosphate kinase|uniref:Transcription elongation factor GreAB n=1 Tax=Methylorubrum rhodesianum TaxID=29427 RepID=A0ABU9Z6E6_9HYPH|nr:MULTISPECIES: transcription elongation factor GreAB [Methylorubrum]MBB5765917.1 transcription elongation GreA/GreB family factor [Methylorubrum rhodesianum]MBI1692215.1 transcription elongation factor GreAB [Methylorubrum sp. DB1722]MBK3406745.1 transcription elongation factor GreAB [Methylorubrum rhodesianum]MBY0144038.1 transcription elongation factor GreAB [Methylorubrum populi]